MLLVDQQFRITDDVYEQDMRDFELNFLFNRRQHPLTLRHNKAIHNSVFPRAVESKAGSKSRAATAAFCHGRSRTACSRSRSLFEIRNPRSKIRNRTVPVVQRKEQGFPKTKRVFYHTSSAIVPTTQTTFARSLHWKLRHPTSSGVCPFLCSRVTQRVTQNSALFWLGADCVALFVRCLGRGRLGELLEARIDESGNIIGTHVCCNLRKNSGGWKL